MILDVEDENQYEIIPSMVGRTITAITRELDTPGNGFHHGENSVSITLDDGRVLRFTGHGYDASGLWMTVEST